MLFFNFTLSIIEVKLINEPTFWSEYGLGITSGFISICAIFISWRSLEQNRQHNILSVKPLLLINDKTVLGHKSKWRYEIEIVNCGLGPITIIDIKIKAFDKIFYDFEELYKENYNQTLLEEAKSNILKYRAITDITASFKNGKGKILNSGDGKTYFGVQFVPNSSTTYSEDEKADMKKYLKWLMSRFLNTEIEITGVDIYGNNHTFKEVLKLNPS